jgi:hypothetical protein
MTVLVTWFGFVLHDQGMPEQNDNNLIHFIANTVETLRARLDTISEQMATKADLVNLRDQVAVDIVNLRDQMATKEELAALKEQMATKEDLATLRDQMATKEDLGRVESNLARVESTLDAKTTAIRGDIEQVQIRLDSIDRGMGVRLGLFETEMSRLRSVVYLLVKDKPDMLRLLG